MILHKDMKKIATYEEAVEYILNIPKFASKNTLEKTQEFYRFMGRPGGGAKIIHVAGTNGKGSVCAYMNQILLHGGYRVGLFTSPHLTDIRERIRMSGVMAGKEAFLEAFLEVSGKIEAPYHPTFFEMLFFMAMYLFEKNGMEYIILETGMGGRLDATNVVEKPAVVILTEIGMDHMEYLGSTLEEIAWEKAGILKSGVPVVYQNRNEVTSAVIEKQAAIKQASCYPVSEEAYKNYQIRNKMIDFSWKPRYDEYVTLTLGTRALYQLENVCLALAAAELLGGEDIILFSHIKDAVRKTRWEGRMEEVVPGVYLDGAHNMDAAAALIESLRAGGFSNVLLLFSVVRDKKYEEMIRMLCESGLFGRFFLTGLESERAVPVTELEKIFHLYSDRQITVYEKPEEAFSACIKEKTEENTILAAGSLYLVGAVKRIIDRTLL